MKLDLYTTQITTTEKTGEPPIYKATFKRKGAGIFETAEITLQIKTTTPEDIQNITNGIGTLITIEVTKPQTTLSNYEEVEGMESKKGG